MATRLVPLALAALTVLGVACTQGTTGPAAPASGDVNLDDAMRAAGAREVARAFVQAYATAPQDGGRELETLVGTPLLRRWAGWLQVQNEGFPGTISGDPAGILVGPAVPFEVESVPGSSELLRQVDVRASVTFAFAPADGEPFDVERSLDGPMRLIRGPGEDWSVLDFTRDGIPLTSQFEGVDDARDGDEVTEAAVAAFFAVPTWQFGLVIHTAEALRLKPADLTLVGRDGELVAGASAITTQLERIAAGATIRGLAAFEARPSAEDLFLRLDLGGPHEHRALLIPLQGRIHPIEVAAAPSPSVTSSVDSGG
jgi:hypothetical protein